MVAAGWIAKNLANLATLGVLKTKSKSTDEYLSDLLIARNSNAQGSHNCVKLLLHPKQSNCNKLSSNYRNCSLYNFVREGKVVLREFSSTNEQGLDLMYLTLDTLEDEKEGEISCSYCYYKHRMLTLKERLSCNFLEVQIPMGMNQTQQLFLVGLHIKRNGKLFKCFLTVKYDKKVRKDGKEETEKKTALVSIDLYNNVKYVELIEWKSPHDHASEKYLINRNNIFEELYNKDVEVHLCDLRSVYYIDCDENKLNLGAMFTNAIKDVFSFEDKGNVLNDARETVLYIKKTVEVENENLSESLDLPPIDQPSADQPPTVQPPVVPKNEIPKKDDKKGTPSLFNEKIIWPIAICLFLFAIPICFVLLKMLTEKKMRNRTRVSLL